MGTRGYWKQHLSLATLARPDHSAQPCGSDPACAQQSRAQAGPGPVHESAGVSPLQGHVAEGLSARPALELATQGGHVSPPPPPPLPCPPHENWGHALCRPPGAPARPAQVPHQPLCPRDQARLHLLQPHPRARCRAGSPAWPRAPPPQIFLLTPAHCCFNPRLRSSKHAGECADTARLPPCCNSLPQQVSS